MNPTVEHPAIEPAAFEPSPPAPGPELTEATPSEATPAERAANAKRALAWTQSTRFLTTASKLEQLPPPGLAEFAFVGRSNAGKSTAINTLAQQRQLAFASRTPGRTQHINLFELGPADAPDTRWADLPGYGYAAVSRSDKRRWQKVMADYLEHRHALAGIVLMVDSRHGFTPLDEQLLAFIAPRVGSGEVRLLVLLTKADKLNRNDAAKSLLRAQQKIGTVEGLASDAADIGMALFSALSRQGVADVAATLMAWRDAGVPVTSATASTAATAATAA